MATKKEPIVKKPTTLTEVEEKEIAPKFDNTQLTALLEVQIKIDEDRKERSGKLVDHQFAANLADSSQSITRGERKEFKIASELEVKHYAEFDEDQKEILLDFLLESRSITGADDIGEGELLMWVELIIGRTVNPLYFEGK